MEQVAWILALMLAFIVAPLVLWSRRERRLRRGIPSDPHTPDTNSGQDLVPTPASTERSSSAGTRGRMRRRPVSAAASSSSSSAVSLVAVSEPEIYDAGDEAADEAVEATYYKPKQSKKKNERKHEKEMRREAENAVREIRSQKEERLSQLRRQKDEEREAEERKKEEEAERQKLKEEEAAAAEFDKWKTAFSIETEGTQEQDVQEEGQGLLNNFVDYIKKHKCVALEDLAAEFNLRTQDCINRVLALEQMGRISGVMDERGKFIYISPEEMKAVADYIKRLGRVSISHLASKSNEFIDLEAKTLASDCAQEAEIPAEHHLSGSQISVG
ncbi:unnamed protein product [Calypogeia fissa]